MNQKGFSAIELMLSFAIFAVVSVVIFQTFQIGLNGWGVIAAESYITGEARMAIERMSRELRSSKLSNVDTSQDGQIRFKVPSEVTTTGVITEWSNWIQYSRGGINGNQLIRTDTETGATSVLANNVMDLGFAINVNPSTVSMTVTSRSTTPRGTVVPIVLTSAVELRN